MNRNDMELLYEECNSGNDRACNTLERLCEDGVESACTRIEP